MDSSATDDWSDDTTDDAAPRALRRLGALHAGADGAKMCDTRLMIERGDYGVVRIVRGKHKGKLGYYDDEDVEGAIVYLTGPPTLVGSRYVLVRFSSLEPATEEEERRWMDDNDNDIQWAKATRFIRNLPKE